MRKKGPCCHCGITSTPLWRHGPPEKPVLCNACGMRFRTRGTLANYTPLHAQAETGNGNQRVSRVKISPLNKNKEVKPRKRKMGQTDDAVLEGFAPYYDQGFQKVVDENTSNRSSSGSVISNTESFSQFRGADATDFTGRSQSVAREAMVPAKNRTSGGRPKHSMVEKLTKDLRAILHEQQSYLSATSEEDILIGSDTPMVSVEIGYGCILLKHPSTIASEEDSEASSLSVDNKQCVMSEAYSCSSGISLNSNCNGMDFSSPGVDRVMQQEELKRDKSKIEGLQYLGDHHSPLCLIDLNDIVNYEEFAKNLTNEEQQQLLKYLTEADTANVPNSLKMMLRSSQFKENLTYFQQLLAEGVFDISLLGEEHEDCKTLKRLALSNHSKSKWVEHYNFLKSCKDHAGKSVAMGSPGMASSDVTHDSQIPDLSELMKAMTIPDSVTLPSDGSSYRMDSLNFDYESSVLDMLLEEPWNPQAELLNPTASSDAQGSTSSS